MKITIALFLSLLASMSWAADPEYGAELYNETEFSATLQGELREGLQCATCHEPDFYTRDDRQALTYGNLRYWVGACNMRLDVGWFPDEVEDVVAYLNQEYYQHEYSPEL